MNTPRRRQSTGSRLSNEDLVRLGDGSLARLTATVESAGVLVVYLSLFGTATGHWGLTLAVSVAGIVAVVLWTRHSGCRNRPTNDAAEAGPLQKKQRIWTMVCFGSAYIVLGCAPTFFGHNWRLAAATVPVLAGICTGMLWKVFYPHPRPVEATAAETAGNPVFTDRLQLAAACAMRGMGCTPGWREVHDKRISRLLGIGRGRAASVLDSLAASGLADNRRSRGWNPGKDPDTVYGQLTAKGLRAVEAELARLVV